MVGPTSPSSHRIPPRSLPTISQLAPFPPYPTSPPSHRIPPRPSPPTAGDGRVYVWDMAARDCVHCFTDEGCLVGTTVSISPNGRYVACGSDSGVVNVYEAEECLRNAAPRPLRAVMNLTTSIEHICFNSTRYFLYYYGHTL